MAGARRVHGSVLRTTPRLSKLAPFLEVLFPRGLLSLNTGCLNLPLRCGEEGRIRAQR